MSGWRRGLQQVWDRQPAVIGLAIGCLIANAIALIAVLFLLLSPVAH